MNLFYLDHSIQSAVQYHCDKHVVKMCLETAQLLCTALHRYKIASPYKPTHINHPTTLWIGDSIQHFRWARQFGLALCKEYTWRYTKIHASENVINSLPTEPPLPNREWRDPPQAMPDKYKTHNVIDAYRHFYRAEKYIFATWTKRPIPFFMQSSTP